MMANTSRGANAAVMANRQPHPRSIAYSFLELVGFEYQLHDPKGWSAY
jgi:hypothetical protein